MVEGPLAPYFEPYAEYLADQGYSQVSYWKKTFLINEFSRWLSWEGISVNEITAAHEEAFLRDRAQHRCLKRGDGIALSGVTDWLQEKCIIECRTTASVETSATDRVLREYSSYLHEDRGLVPTSLGALSYFAKPYHSWERGLNEHTNGLFKQTQQAQAQQQQAQQKPNILFIMATISAGCSRAFTTAA